MSNNSTIDKIFKEGLPPTDDGQSEAGWQKVEAQLRRDKGRRRAFYLLALLLLLGGATALYTTVLHKPAALSNTGTGKSNSIITDKQPAAPVAEQRISDDTQNNNAPVAVIPPPMVFPQRDIIDQTKLQAALRNKRNNNKNNDNDPAGINVQSPSTIVTTNGRAATTITQTDAATVADETVTTTQPDVNAKHTGSAINTGITDEATLREAAQVNKPLTVTEKNKEALVKARKPKKLQFELAAGVDPFGDIKDRGRYALAMVRIPLNQRANLVVGAGYNSHSMSESYRINEKQYISNREADAKLQGLTMLQLPIMYEQTIPRTKFLMRVGVIPVYLLDATVVNVANSFNGSVIPFRSFTLTDLNRFHALFSAGVQYRLAGRLSTEVKGNYGLTGLVKRSYINQSSENNNFKSIQVGLLFRIGGGKISNTAR